MTAPDLPASMGVTNTAGCVRGTGPLVDTLSVPLPIGPGPTPIGPQARNAPIASSIPITGTMIRLCRLNLARSDLNLARGETSVMSSICTVVLVHDWRRSGALRLASQLAACPHFALRHSGGVMA